MIVSAKIIDNTTKQPLPNVNIKVNDVSKTKTDANGNFTLTVNDSDIVETSFVGYAPFFTLANTFPKTVYLDNTGYVLNEVVIKNVFKKTPWLLWLGLGLAVGGVSIYAYKKNQKAKTPIKAKI